MRGARATLTVDGQLDFLGYKFSGRGLWERPRCSTVPLP
jgi:hypothetical protein